MGERISSTNSNLQPTMLMLSYCGDLGGYGHEPHSIASLTSAQERDAAYFYGILDSMAIDTHFILGNDDWFESDDRRHLLQPAMLGEYPLIPFEWVSTTPFMTNREAHDNKLTYELSKIHADSNTIVLAHTPPFGVGDLLYNGQHCGSRAVRRWIETTSQNSGCVGTYTKTTVPDTSGRHWF